MKLFVKKKMSGNENRTLGRPNNWEGVKLKKSLNEECLK